MPESTAYLIETVRGIGLSIAASYFRDEFHQPKLQSVFRRGNEIGKRWVFCLGFFNDLLTPVGSKRKLPNQSVFASVWEFHLA